MPLPRLPGPDEAVLHLFSDAGQVGPLSRRQLRQRVDAGEVASKAHVWMEGMDGWEPLADHREALAAGLDAPPSTPPASPRSRDDELDQVFVDLVKSSWDYLGEHRFAAHIDEVFLGAVITSTLDTGYSLIDLKSDGTHHFLRFENLSDQSRIVVRLTHLTASLAVSKVVGQRVSAILGYGERVGNLAKIWSALQAELKSSYLQDAEPGTITVDGDLNSGYVYCQVDLYLDVEQYVARDYRVDHARLANHVGAVTHALRKYLRGRFT
jgi:hypothetical protein